MNQLQKLRAILYSILLIAIAFSSCKKDELEEDNEDTNKTDYSVVLEWVHEIMSSYYYWNDEIPKQFDVVRTTKPDVYFYDLVYEQEDKWSYITDDYETLVSQLQGTPTSMGYSPAFGLFSNSSQVFIVVEYVYPNSPADNAGLERGDIILLIDGEKIDTTNYYEKFQQASYSVTLGEISGNNINITGEVLSMTAKTLAADPLIHYEVLEGTKTGYMVYVEFVGGETQEYLASLDKAFDYFTAQNVSELIVDLRYNPGGEIVTAAYIASAIAPKTVVDGKKVMTQFMYNDKLQDTLVKEYGTESSVLKYRFQPNAHRVDLSRVYFLTTSGSASASELIITGLEPYMDVVHVGEITYGKYTGSWVIPDTENPARHNWAAMPIVTKYANSVGYTDFKDGLTPDILVEDHLMQAKPFGDVDDPMIKAALAHISGVKTGAIKKTVPAIEFKQIYSRNYRQRQNLFLPLPQ